MFFILQDCGIQLEERVPNVRFLITPHKALGVVANLPKWVPKGNGERGMWKIPEKVVSLSLLNGTAQPNNSVEWWL